MTAIIYKKDSYAIIGACFEVYNEKGCGFFEPKTISNDALRNFCHASDKMRCARLTGRSKVQSRTLGSGLNAGNIGAELT
jgi:hypothetical protein